MDSTDWAALQQAGIDGYDEVDYSMDYRIVMLGTSGVGKTAFMTTMLHRMLNDHKGMRLTADSALVNQVNSNYSKLCKDGILAGTGSFSDWKFTVHYNQTILFNFRWVDYRGKIISPVDLTTRRIDQEFNRLYDFLKKSVAVFVLADAQRMVSEPREVWEELNAIRACIEATKNVCNRGIHLVLILTKVDAVALKFGWFRKTWDEGLIINMLNESFGGVFRNFVSRFDDVWCDVVPVSAFGLSAEKVNGSVQVVNKPQLEPYQIEVPLWKVFASILRDIDRMIPEMQMALKQLRSDNLQQVELAKEHLLDSVLSWDILTTNGRQTARSHFSRADYHQRQLQACEKHINYLQRKRKVIKRLVNEADMLRGNFFSY